MLVQKLRPKPKASNINVANSIYPTGFRKGIISLSRTLNFLAGSSVKPGDFNGDGLEDLVVWVEGSHALEIMINNGYDGFLKSVRKSFGSKSIDTLFIADINNDYLDDMIVTLRKPRFGLETKVFLNITQEPR